MLILILSPVLPSGCAPIPASDACAGWAPIYMAPASPDWLNANDPDLLRAIIAHDEFWQQSCLWK